jgi:hypothetical protein
MAQKTPSKRAKQSTIRNDLSRSKGVSEDPDRPRLKSHLKSAVSFPTQRLTLRGYGDEFERHFIENGIYPVAHGILSDGSREPNNIENIKQELLDCSCLSRQFENSKHSF